MAAPELVLGEKFAQTLYFPLVTPIKLLKHENIMHYIPLSAKETGSSLAAY